MREVSFLHYAPGNTIWHHHDSRLKILELSCWSVIAFLGNPVSLASLGVIQIILHLSIGTRIKDLRRPLLFWLAMASAMVLAAGIGDSNTLRISINDSTLHLPFGSEGLLSGAIRAARLLAVLLAGQFLAATTDPSDLADSVRKLMRFFPRKWSAGVATTITLTLSFIPLIFDEAATARDAAFSRGLGLRRSLVRRAAALGLPMVEGTLRRADITSEALLSRCISDNPTPTYTRLKAQDIALFLLLVLPGAASAFLYNPAP